MKTRWLNMILLTLILAGCANAPDGESTQKKTQEDQEIVLYFVRHGKTMLNTVDRSQGWIDAPLTPAGIEVAEQVGKGLKDVVFNQVVSSDSGRAIETAELILCNNGQKKLMKDISKDQRLREYNFGTYEGQMNDEMKSAVGKQLGLSLEEYKQKMTDNGFYSSIIEFADLLASMDQTQDSATANWLAEDSQTIKKRLMAALDDIIQNAKKDHAQNVLVISHGMSIATLLAELDKTAEFPVNGLKNASVSKVIYKNGSYIVESVNDLSYVEKGKNNVK